MDLSFGQLRTSGLTGMVQADMRRLPIRAGSVDAIWCHAALLHIPRTVVPAVLAEFARVTRPGGELFLAVVEGDGEGFEVASKYGSHSRRWFTMHREPELAALLAGAGFAVYQMRRTPGGRVWLHIHARRANNN
jgi:SAM-dependent methyltransferase